MPLSVPQHPFTFALERDGAVRVHIDPQLIVGNRVAFRRQVVELIAAGTRRVILDLAACGYIDASGLGVLVAIGKQLRDAGGALVFEHVSEDIAVLFALTRLDTLFTIEREAA